MTYSEPCPESEGDYPAHQPTAVVCTVRASIGEPASFPAGLSFQIAELLRADCSQAAELRDQEESVASNTEMRPAVATAGRSPGRMMNCRPLSFLERTAQTAEWQ